MTNGCVKFARYAVPPNSLGYCGVGEPQPLVEMVSDGDRSGELRRLLSQFSGAVPHLAEIARVSGHGSIFDDSVVEAYWVGNPLLRLTNAGGWARRVGSARHDSRAHRLIASLFEGAPDGAWQHHSFQVFSSMAHRNDFSDRLEAMDGCRIGWGRVRRAEGGTLWVARSPLVETAQGIRLGRMETVPVGIGWSRLCGLEEVAEGDWVSTHWGWACERLTRREVSNLAAATLHNLRQFWPEANAFEAGMAAVRRQRVLAHMGCLL